MRGAKLPVDEIFGAVNLMMSIWVLSLTSPPRWGYPWEQLCGTAG